MCNSHRRCPGGECPEAREAHNARRRHNRKLREGAARYARDVLQDTAEARRVAKLPPGQAKEWALERGLGTDVLGTSPHRFGRHKAAAPKPADAGGRIGRPVPDQAAQPGAAADPGGPLIIQISGQRLAQLQAHFAAPAPAVPPRHQQRPSPEQQSPQLAAQINTQLIRQGANPVERLMLDSTPEHVQILGEGSGVNTTYRVDLGNGMVGYHKPLVDIDEENRLLEREFGQDNPGQQQIHEVAAWRVAERLGRPWSDMVAPCVLREVNGKLGSLSLERAGETCASPIYVAQETPHDMRAAAFFDALVGQQDRHMGNYLYDRAHKRLTLIDHGFSFAKPGDPQPSSFLQGYRLGRSPELSGEEKGALHRLLDSPDSFGLDGLLEPARIEAMRSRARRMLASGLLCGRA